MLLLLAALIVASPAERPLVEAAAHGDLPKLERALAGGATKDPQELIEALIAASSVGHGPIVDRLLRAGADVNGRAREGGITPLILAAYTGQTAIVSKLLAAKADPNVTNNDIETALHSSAASARAGEVV